MDEVAKCAKDRGEGLTTACDQRFRKYRRDEAGKVLAEFGQEPAKTEDLKKAQEEIDRRSACCAAEVKQAVDKVRAEMTALLKSKMESAELSKAAERAELRATANQKDGEVRVLQSTLENLKFEIGEQRKRTQSVADAGRQGAISQTFGK